MRIVHTLEGRDPRIYAFVHVSKLRGTPLLSIPDHTIVSGEIQSAASIEDKIHVDPRSYAFIYYGHTTPPDNTIKNDNREPLNTEYR